MFSHVTPVLQTAHVSAELLPFVLGRPEQAAARGLGGCMRRQMHTPTCHKKQAEGGSMGVPKEAKQREVHPGIHFPWSQVVIDAGDGALG